ncbi:MAG: Cysteine-rich secretory protein family protein [Microgenomates bacterium OLB22]|nr:MAG: Cysteine-rich secretory protein family protein [Microgenomates bacterium OLB22]
MVLLLGTLIQVSVVFIQLITQQVHAYTGNRTAIAASLPLKELPTPTILPTQTPSPTPTLTPQPTRIPPKPTATPEWGVAKKVDDHTYTIAFQYDSTMTSPGELFSALNSYRNTHGVATLAWDDKLAGYAQGRAAHFSSIKATDAHAGFNDYLDNHNGFEELGYYKLGENSYYGGPVSGTHVIEWVFAQSPGHNANQLGTAWSHVGIGVSDTGINLVFGGDKK